MRDGGTLLGRLQMTMPLILHTMLLDAIAATFLGFPPTQSMCFAGLGKSVLRNLKTCHVGAGNLGDVVHGDNPIENIGPT